MPAGVLKGMANGGMADGEMGQRVPLSTTGLRKWGRWFLLLGVALFLTGCSDFVDRDQVTVSPEARVVLEPGHTVGQTFVARHGGLNGVEVWLEPEGGARGELHLHLRSEPGAAEEVASSTLSLSDPAGPGFYRFSFPPLKDSHSRYYYAFLEMTGEGRITVGAGPGNAYLDGALYRDHEPQDAQAAFRLTYAPLWLAADLLKASVAGLGLLVVAALLYLVPGYALLAWVYPHPSLGGWGEGLPWPARMGLAAGLSLALYPLLLLWTDLVGLHWGPLYAWVPVVGGLAALVWRYRRWRPQEGWDGLRRWARSESFWPDLALVFILALVFGVRLLVVRGLDAPMWGDSYQHTVIAQLLVDHGGLFDSWEPYAELRTFTYHFGFHSAVAAFHWLTEISVYQATLWVGQILNGFAIVALYPLVIWMGGNRWSGVVAALVAGLLLPMPMRYVNWGRYTQLAGQVILPAAVMISGTFLESPRRNWALAGMAWVAISGLALTHYRVLIFYVVFVAAWLVLHVRKSNWRHPVARVAGAGIGSAVLFLPWFLHTFAGQITRSFAKQLSTPPESISTFTRQYNAIGDITAYMSPMMWMLFAVAIGSVLWRRRRGGLFISLWWFLLLIATNPGWLHLPGSGAISNFALFIGIYIPAGLLVGDALGEWIAQWDKSRWRAVLFAAVGCALGVSGFLMRMKDVQVAPHALVTRPDLRAMAWIREHTPADARFLVNSFFAYGGSAIVGSDGGWWLPLLAGRANTVPPLNYGTEQGPFPNYREWMNELTAQIQEKGIDHPETVAELRRRSIGYVYIGQQQGRVNYQGPGVLDPEVLLNSRPYRLVYHQDRVWVFEVIR